MSDGAAQGQSLLATDAGSAEERQLEREGRWEELIGSLIESAAIAASPAERLRCYQRAAQVYETQLSDPEKAYITLQAGFGEDYGNEDLGRELERLAAGLGRSGELISEYETALSEASDNDQKVALLIQLARWQERADGGALDGAESKLRRALALEPAAMPAIRAMSDLLSRRNGGDWRRLAEHLSSSGTAVRRHTERAELLLAAAELYHRKLVDLPQAAALYGQVLELDPESVPALEGLVEITWEEENWVRVLPLLEQLAASHGRAPADRSKTHQRAALAALRTGDDERARSHAAKVPDLDPDSSATFVRDWLDIAFSRRWWQDVRTLGQWLQDKVEAGAANLTGAEHGELRARLGQARLEAGELEPARAELEQAVALDPNHRHAREMLADVLGRLGDAAGALEHKKVLVDRVGSNDQRFKMLVEMARASRDQLSNPQEALATFEEARSLKSSERGILHEMLELYTELKQWLPASEVLLSLAEDSVPPERARYLVAAGNILHYEMGDADAAIELYERALDDDPADVKTFERVDKILIAKQDHREQARAYGRMIKRVGPAVDPNADQKRATLLHLWRGLGELYRTHLQDLPAAVAALEVATQLEPTSLREQEALAELYEASGPDSYRAAVEKRTLLFEKTDDTGTMVRQLKSLRAIYAQAGLWDRVFCVCGALTVLQAADAEELAFYERGAAAPLMMPSAALTEEIWQKVIYDPGEERRLSLLYSCVAPVVALARAQDAKALGIKDRFRLEGDSDPSGVARMFEAGAGVLTVAQPAVYLNREFPGDLQIVNLRDPTSGTSVHAVMVGPNIVANRVEKDVAFVVGRTLSLLRPDHLVLAPSVVPTQEELLGIVHAAFKLCQPSAPVPNPGLYQPYLTLFQKMLPPQALEPLASLVPWLIENWRELDVAAWRAAAERTADRAGLLLSGDLGAAVRVMHATRGMAASPSVLELVRWSISEGHLGVRELLGIGIAAPTG